MGHYDTKEIEVVARGFPEVVTQLIAETLFSTNNVEKLEMLMADTKVPVKTVEITQHDALLHPQLMDASNVND